MKQYQAQSAQRAAFAACGVPSPARDGGQRNGASAPTAQM